MKDSNNFAVVYKPGKDLVLDAWVTTFFIENHLDYESYDKVASPEQIRFMVYTDEEDRYYPCSDRMFSSIINKNESAFLKAKYKEVLDQILDLINMHIDDDNEKYYLESLIKIKFAHETRDEIMIPSRLEKRLFKIFSIRSHINDAYFYKKAHRNIRAKRALNSDVFKNAMNYLDNFDNNSSNLAELRGKVEHIELTRLLSLTSEKALWKSDKSINYNHQDFYRCFNRPLIGDGLEKLFQFLGITNRTPFYSFSNYKKILWLANEAGEIIIDFAIIRYLIKLGHKVIIALKGGPLFTKVDFADIQEDEIIKNELEGAFLIKEKNLSKNELLQILKGDQNIIVISDGTNENLNLLLTSVTFSRVFKEVDGIITRGHKQKVRFFDTHFQFTQDIFNILANDQGEVEIRFKPKHSEAIKFSHKELEKKAKTIILEMENAKKSCKPVMFYSGIIGSIPGQIKTAIKVMSVFIQYIREQFAMTFIINPSEYFEPGMDADDLMYMWEIVQRSGFIDIWRFQAYEDIVMSFNLMGEKVPTEWVGKDSTFSTGCTKEMDIANDVLKKNPEMQIIGPSKEKFTRRREYGVGKMFDARLKDK